MTFIAIVIYAVVQIVGIPFAIVGVSLVAYRQMITSRKLGVSSTAIEVINGRWTMDVFGIRRDPAARALNPVLPNNSVVGLWLTLFPVYLLSRMSGRNFFYPRVPSEGEEGIADLVVARTIYFDEIIESAKHGAEQFVLLGAGFDTRAYGQLKSLGMDFYELDQVETQRLKRACLERAAIDCDHVTFVEVDFSKDHWYEKLAEAGYDETKKTIFLWEGVTLYLSGSDVRKTLADIRTHTAHGSVVVADFYAESFVSGDYAFGMKAGKSMLKLTDEELAFGLDFSDAPDAALTQFLGDQGLSSGQRRFLGSSSKKGPYMVVAEMLVQKN